MILRLLFLALGIGTAKLLLDLLSEDIELEDLDHEQVSQDFLINQDEENLGLSVLKGKITKAINSIKKDSTAFKIGKTGDSGQRQDVHANFDQMYLLCSTSDEELVDELESYYTAKYIDDPKNLNEKVGSAGDAKALDGQYFLYVVVQS